MTIFFSVLDEHLWGFFTYLTALQIRILNLYLYRRIFIAIKHEKKKRSSYVHPPWEESFVRRCGDLKDVGAVLIISGRPEASRAWKRKTFFDIFLALSPIIFQGSYSFLRESWIFFGIYRNCIFTIKTQGYDSCNMIWTETQLSRVCPKINNSPIALIQEKVILVNWATFKTFAPCNWELAAHFMRLCLHFTYYSHFQFWKFCSLLGNQGCANLVDA